MASICVAFLSFCCDSLPLTLSFAAAPFSLSAFLSLHPWRPFMLSCRATLRSPGAESVEQGRTGLGATDTDREILACPGCCDCCGGCSLSWLRKHMGSTSRGWTTASFTSVCHREHDSRLIHTDIHAWEVTERERDSMNSQQCFTTFLRCGAAGGGFTIKVHNFTSSGWVHLFWQKERENIETMWQIAVTSSSL